MGWRPSAKTARYDRRRVAAFAPVEQALRQLELPLHRERKPGAICNAIEIQIEDGGDHPEVNDLLMQALRLAILHQVGEEAAEPVLRALEKFQKSEEERWRQLRSGRPLPPQPEEQIDDHVEAEVSPGPAKGAPRPGRNDPCWCGSGKKYKRCHLAGNQG